MFAVASWRGFFQQPVVALLALALIERQDIPGDCFRFALVRLLDNFVFRSGHATYHINQLTFGRDRWYVATEWRCEECEFLHRQPQNKYNGDFNVVYLAATPARCSHS